MLVTPYARAIRRIVLAVAVLALSEKSLRAQSPATTVTGSHREWYLGAGVFAAPNNASARVALPTAASRGLLIVDGALLVGRFGIGAEVLRSGRAAGTPEILRLRDDQYDVLLAGTARFRMFMGSLVRVDAVAAFGAAVQRHETVTLECFTHCIRSEQTNTASTFLAGAGLDVPVAITSNVDLAGLFRLYAFERPPVAPVGARGTWASRPMLGISGRLRW